MKIKRLYIIVALLSSALLLCSCSSRQNKGNIDNSNNDTITNIKNKDNSENDTTENNTPPIDSDEINSSDKSNNKNDSSSEQEVKKRYITGNIVRIRALPSTSADILAHLNRGDEVIFLEAEGEWIKLKIREIEGFVHNDFISEMPPEEISSEVTSNSLDTPIASPGIVVKKSERILELWDGDSLYGSYPIGLGFSPEGHKTREGDGKTPVGTYYVCTRNSNSRFYLSLGVSYPNQEDASTALDEGRIDQNTYRQITDAINSQAQPPWNTALGGEIMIHGMGSSSDWTAGCIAVDNEVMDILWRHVKLKTVIEILP